MNERSSAVPACSSPPGPPAAGRRTVLNAGATALALGGVSALPVRAAAQGAPAGGGAPPGPPADRIARAVARVPDLARGILAQTGVPGMAVAVVAGDAPVFLGGFGVRELGSATPVDADTVFQLASVSKSLSATTVAAVVGDGPQGPLGAAGWDARMADVAPGFALRDAFPTQEVTLTDLFAHRSGLPDHAGDLLEDLGYSADEVIRRLRYLTPAYSFRAGSAYTNFGVSAAAYAVARAAGKAWDDLCAERLYAPLGMAGTSSRFADYMARANRAVPHVQEGGRWRVTPQQRDPDAQTPAGGGSSSARDMVQWLRLHLGGGAVGGRRLIPAAALAPMYAPQSVRSPAADPATQLTGFYGLGMDISYTDTGAVQAAHSGAFALGAGTAYYLLPGIGFGVLALTNGAPGGAAEAMCLSVLDLAQRGEVSRDWMTLIGGYFAQMAAQADYSKPVNPGGVPPGAAGALVGTGNGGAAGATPAAPGPPLAPAAYTGTYRNDFFGAAEVAAGAGGLVLRLGPAPREFPLEAAGRDAFTWQPSGENATGPSLLTFTVGADGRATAFTDAYLAIGAPPGTLTRTDT